MTSPDQNAGEYPSAGLSGRGVPAGEAADGVAFPLVDGRRSTAATGRAVLADAVRTVDAALADEALAVGDWRSGYLGPYRDLTALDLTRPGAAAMIAASGLESVHHRFVLAGPDGDRPLAPALAAALDGARVPALHTATVTGGAPPDRMLSVPYRGGRLAGADLDRRLDAWLEAGVAEPSFAAAVRAVAADPEWLDLRDLTVVVLGAGAEMGPLVSLLRWGAHVVAVDLPRPQLWRRLVEIARGSAGRLSVPVSRWLPDGAPDDEIVAAAGADLLTQAPDLLAWLAAVEGPFTLGNYVYLDGAAHVRASVAVDALTAALLERRGADLSLAFLATPTDVFGVPAEVVDDAARRYREGGPGRGLGRVGRAVTGGRLLRPHYTESLTLPDGGRAGLADSLVPQQGPNYALAKRIQRWRATHERLGGRLVSVNVAPATRTRSVTRNRLLAAAFTGAHRFGVEVFDPSTSNTLMAALLVHDLRNPASVANPATPLAHPAQLFWDGANHGGLWRTPYAPRSVLGLAVVLGMVQRSA
jgi:hypothetical protein